VHKDHALVLVNLGEATGEEILLLAQEMSQSTLDRYGIALETEVRII
jgi:UDP-N-acetylmuramate dehydrogenase